MKEITEISERVLYIIEYLKVSKNDFAKTLGYSRSQVIYDITSGKAKPSFEFFSKFMNSEYSEYFSLEWLITGKGNFTKQKIQNMLPKETVTNTVTFLEETKNTENVTQLVNESQKVYNSTPQVVTVDKHGKDNIVMVPVKAAAGYLRGYGDAQFIDKLPTYSLPNINNGTFRMFQVAGHSMHPTLMDKSFVVGEWVENWVKSVKDNRVYVIVCDEGVLVKRVLNRLKKYGNLYLKSDNRKEYPNINIEPERIFEVWEVKMHIATELPDPAVMYDRMNDLEAEMEHIKSLLKGKN